MGFSTDAIHAGQPTDLTSRVEFVPPAAAVSGDDAPCRALESRLAALERGEAACAFATGEAALAAVGSLLASGDHLVATAGARELLKALEGCDGIAATLADTWDLKQLESCLRDETRMVLVQTPSPPSLDVTDLAAAAALTHEAGALLVVDNTWATPYFQTPLRPGADIVVHATTSNLEGHSDGNGGVVVVKDAELGARLDGHRKGAGTALGRFDAWLAFRGLETLALRMRQANATALAAARFLKAHEQVSEVRYPGLSSHPQYALARTQMSGFGGLVAFRLSNGDRAEPFMAELRLVKPAEALGGVESRVRETDGLMLLSVGCEDSQDLLADLDQALAH